jgi:hypothetical protein
MIPFYNYCSIDKSGWLLATGGWQTSDRRLATGGWLFVIQKLILPL